MCLAWDAHAFNIKTHIWLAEQILADVNDDGKVTITIDGQLYEYEVDEKLKQSLNQNAGAYISGMLGPDAFPDPIIGQSIVHPGISDPNTNEIIGWQTDDWLQYLTSDFYDTQNAIQQSGSACLDGSLDTETDAQIRDLLTAEFQMLNSNAQPLSESLRTIAERVYFENPSDSEHPFKTQQTAQNSNSLLELYRYKFQNINTSRESDWEEFSLGQNFQTEILADPLQGECLTSTSSSSSIAFSFGYLSHSISDMWAHSYVNMYSGDKFNIADNLDAEIRHIMLEKYIANATPALVTEQHEIAPPTAYLVDKLIFDPTVREEYKKTGTSTHLTLIASLYDELDRAANSGVLVKIDQVVMDFIVQQTTGMVLSDEQMEQLQDLLQRTQDIVNASIDEMQDIKDQLEELTNDLLQDNAELRIKLINEIEHAADALIESEARLLELTLRIDELVSRIGEKTSRRVCKRWGFFGIFSCKVIKEWNRVQKRLIRAKKKLIKERKRLLKRHIATRAKTFRETVQKVTEILIVTRQEMNEQLNYQIDLAQRFSADFNIIRAALIGWRSDIDLSMREYTKAWNSTLSSTAYGTINFDSVNNWLDCYAPSIIGIPSELTLSQCSARDYLSYMLEQLTEIRNSHLMGMVPGIEDLINEIEEKITGELKSLGETALEKITEKLLEQAIPSEMQTLLKAMQADSNDSSLNISYTTNSGSRYLSIPDIAQRVKKEMHIRTDGTFDPNKYPVIFNSLQLMKMSLLSVEQLNEVANTSVHGSANYLPVNTQYFDRPIIFDVLRSIDGNHNWLTSAPIYPRQANQEDTTTTEQREYGFAGYDNKGFTLWENEELREKAFNKIFIGPLSQGLESPIEINSTTILPERYPYRGCQNEPFPVREVSYSCGARVLDYLIPILLIQN
jgi:hypothetical protein